MSYAIYVIYFISNIFNLVKAAIFRRKEKEKQTMSSLFHGISVFIHNLQIDFQIKWFEKEIIHYANQRSLLQITKRCYIRHVRFYLKKIEQLKCKKI